MSFRVQGLGFRVMYGLRGTESRKTAAYVILLVGLGLRFLCHCVSSKVYGVCAGVVMCSIFFSERYWQALFTEDV